MTVDTLTHSPLSELRDPRLYQNIHFRLNAGDRRDSDPETHFFPEIAAILTDHGFTVRPSDGLGRAPRGVKGAETLYAHPHDLAGYLLEETISPLMASLSAAQSFRVLAVDRYELAFHYTPQEFEIALTACREDIARAILAQFRTRKRNLFYSRDRLMSVRTGLHYLHTRDVNYAREVDFIDEVFEDLLAQGRFVSTVHQGYPVYRTREFM